jgi:hypothetical protein
MTKFRTAFLSLPLLALPAAPALALTAEEVWADWTQLARAADVTIAATTRREGDRLVVSGISIPVGPPGERVNLQLDRIELQDLPDGRVAVLLPPSFPVTIEGPGNAGPERVILSASAQALSLVVSGIGETAAFDLTAPSMSLALDRIEPPVDETVEATMAVADLVVKHRMDLLAETQEVATTASLGALRGEVRFDDGKEERGTITLDVAGMTSALNAVLPPGFAQDEPRGPDAAPNALPEILDFLAQGLRLSGEATVTGFAMKADLNGSSEGGLVDMTLESGKFSAGLDQSAAHYEIALGKMGMIGRDLPEAELSDIEMSLKEAGYGVSVGIGDLVSPQDARFWVRLTDLALPPEAWAEADPSGALGTEPISWALEVTARYALGAEMLQPDWQPVPGVVPPVDLIEVALKELAFAGAGIRVGGSGALGFDESDLVTFDGVPAPEGKLSFTAEGVNGLIDRLVAAGMVPEDELTGIRMGLMFIAKAGPTPDSLVSLLEFRDKGFFLNGIKIR